MVNVVTMVAVVRMVLMVCMVLVMAVEYVKHLAPRPCDGSAVACQAWRLLFEQAFEYR